jgi:hypothetical protein
MKLSDLLEDHSVAAVRKKKWALPNRLELPPIINGHRGPWAKLHAFDGVDQVETPLLMMTCMDDADDWEAWITPAAPAQGVRRWRTIVTTGAKPLWSPPTSAG